MERLEFNSHQYAPFAATTAPRERLAREQRKDETVENLVEEIMAIGKHCATLPLLDARSADEIIG